MVVRRGEIWWAELGAPRGSEPGYSRPVLVISGDAFNASTIRTVIVAALTTNLALAAAPGNVPLSPSVSGLPKPSVANVTQLLTLDKSYLTRKVRKLPPKTLAAVEAGLRLALELK